MTRAVGASKRGCSAVCIFWGKKPWLLFSRKHCASPFPFLVVPDDNDSSPPLPPSLSDEEAFYSDEESEELAMHRIPDDQELSKRVNAVGHSREGLAGIPVMQLLQLKKRRSVPRCLTLWTVFFPGAGTGRR